MSKVCVYREAGKHSSREYLVLRNYAFEWISTANYDTWNECKADATPLTPVEATFALQLVRLANPLRAYDYDYEIEDAE